MLVSTKRIFVVCALVLGMGCPAMAQRLTRDWANKMFDKNKIDFGVIARGADARQSVRIDNRTGQTVHISNVRTTCGCSAATPTQTTLQPGEFAMVEVTMDTRKFQRRKDSNVIVDFDQPARATVTIPITSYIRTDVVFTPGSVLFNNVDKGKDHATTMNIAYAGRADWKIKEVRSSAKYIQPTIRETQRVNGNVRYALEVKLSKDAPAGRIRQLLTLVTDDASNPYVPVLVEGKIESDISILPALVQFGRLSPGQEKNARVVLKGKKPFLIEGIECESDLEAFKVRMPRSARTVHVLPLTVMAPSKSGKFTEEFILRISGRTEPLRFKAAGEVQ